jgi:DNA polymerase-4
MRVLFRRNWNTREAVRLLGVQASSFEVVEGQMDLLDSERQGRWKRALSATDRLRDRFGEEALGLASGMRGRYRERTHENPASLSEPRKPGPNKPGHNKPGHNNNNDKENHS